MLAQYHIVYRRVDLRSQSQHTVIYRAAQDIMSKDSVVIDTDESLTFEPLWFCVLTSCQ
jgi:hypothetical protein